MSSTSDNEIKRTQPLGSAPAFFKQNDILYSKAALLNAGHTETHEIWWDELSSEDCKQLVQAITSIHEVMVNSALVKAVII